MNILYTMTLQGEVCTSQMIDSAIDDLLALSSNTYDILLYQMPEKQRTLFMAIASANKAKVFIRKYHLHYQRQRHLPSL